MIVENSQKTYHFNGKQGIVTSWENLKANEEGARLSSMQYDQACVQVSGSFGEGGSVVIEGSNDGVSFYTLSDNFGNTLYFTKTGLKSINESPVYVRPRVISGDSLTSVTILITAKA